MEDLKQAYAALGLPETASKEELENRYYLLTRRARAQKMREGAEPPAEGLVDLDAVTEAYRFIRDYEERQAKAEYEQQVYGKYKKMAGKAQKWDHFFHYYKFHILIGIVVLALIGYGMKSYADHRAEQERLAKLPPADVSVMFFGNYLYGEGFGSDTEPLANDILKQFPDWKRVVANLTYVPSDMKSEQDMALLQKSMLVLMEDKSDLFIVDKANFDKLAAQGAFLPLDSLSGSSVQSLLQSGAARKAKTEDDPTEKVYGIDLSGTGLGKELGVNGSSEFIAAVRTKAQKPDNAVKFIEHYLNEAKS
jgi:hypothetical protein